MHFQPKPKQGEPFVPKVKQKFSGPTFNIVESMKKTIVSMTMIDALHIPRQKDLLQEALTNLSLTNEPQKDQTKVVLANDTQYKSNQPAQTTKPPLFYVTLIVGQDLVHNCMIDSGANSSVMPKQLANKLSFLYEPIYRGIIQCDRTSVKSVGVVKDLGLTLHACPNFAIPHDIYIVDLPPNFAICLSRDFTTKLGGYLSFDWSHLFFRTIYDT